MLEMTIREAIKAYTERKSKTLKRDYLDVVNNTGLCIIIPLNNSVRIFIDTHPEMEYLNRDYPLEMPNKNGVFKRISFEILDDGVLPVIPVNMAKCISKSCANGVLYYVDTVKEKVINEFINDNGGINIEEYQKEIISLWE